MSEADRAKWNERHAAGSHLSRAPSPFLLSLDGVLPREGRVLDVAGGAGRNGLWLARRGLDVTICDVSDVGLRIARERAEADGRQVTTIACDLETTPLPAGPWDVVVSILFLDRRLFPQFAEVLAPEGRLVFLQPTVDNLERYPKPPRPFLLERGELRSLVEATGLTIERLEESWSDEGFHEARLVARRLS